MISKLNINSIRTIETIKTSIYFELPIRNVLLFKGMELIVLEANTHLLKLSGRAYIKLMPILFKKKTEVFFRYFIKFFHMHFI